jgi:2-polyprenyl-3-methyl-5-hydroxy-6-metoxy-1,4-benzoquinol methylase
MKNLSEREYWSKEWENEARLLSSFIFAPLIQNYISNLEDKSYFEIGCAPGTIMAFFHKYYGCKISGIDYTSSTIIHKNMEKYGIIDYGLFSEDFLSFKSKKKYDIVASFGFIEHFTDVGTIFKKHDMLLKDNGFLIIEMPNLRYFNKFIYSIFNRSLLKMHNLDIMNLKKLKELASEYKIIYCNYYKSTLFDFNADNIELQSKPIMNKSFKIVSRLIKALRLDNIPNRFFSPYIVLIAQKTCP